MAEVLRISDLTKKYGKITAVNQLDLSIEEGMVFGLLGPNGSGKTTTLGMVLGVTIPTSGAFSWFGNGASHQIRKQIGAILEKPVFYPYMSATKNLKLVAAIKEVSETRIDEVLEIVGLFDRKDDPFKTYSLGMKQRLSIASALLGDPGVLVLDEPTNGLDPEGIAEIRQLIGQIAGMGKTIVLASHLLDEVQKVCSDFCVLRYGRLIHQGPVLAELDSNTFEVSSSDQDKLKAALEDLEGLLKVESMGDGLSLISQKDLTAEAINSHLHQKGVVLSKLITVHKSLEDQFLEILKEDGQAN